MTDIPKMVAWLTEIPDLAAEVAMTKDAPNPGLSSEHSATIPGPQPPTDIATLYALMPDGDGEYYGRGLRGELAMCCRLVIEEMADEMEWDEIPAWPSDTWSGICGWLADAIESWASCEWAQDICSDIKRVRGELRSLARVGREPIYRCPKCHDMMQLQEGGQWLLCDSGHEESANLEARYRRRPMASVSALAEEFDIAPDRIWQWRHRGKLPNVEYRGKEMYAYPWDILLLANPAIREAIATREGTA